MYPIFIVFEPNNHKVMIFSSICAFYIQVWLNFLITVIVKESLKFWLKIWERDKRVSTNVAVLKFMYWYIDIIYTCIYITIIFSWLIRPDSLHGMTANLYSTTQEFLDTDFTTGFCRIFCSQRHFHAWLKPGKLAKALFKV